MKLFSRKLSLFIEERAIFKKMLFWFIKENGFKEWSLRHFRIVKIVIFVGLHN